MRPINCLGGYFDCDWHTSIWQRFNLTLWKTKTHWTIFCLPSLKTEPHMRPTWICFHCDSLSGRRCRDSISICSAHSRECDRSMPNATVMRSSMGVSLNDFLNSEAKFSTPQIRSSIGSVLSSVIVKSSLFESSSKQIFLAGLAPFIGLVDSRFPQSIRICRTKVKSQWRN